MRATAVCAAIAGLTVAGCGAAPHPGQRPAAPAASFRGLSHHACATKPYGAATSSGSAAGSSEVWHFHSAPDLQPMKVKVLQRGAGRAAGLVFVDPYALDGPPTGQTGALILDEAGNPVWFRPLPSTELMDSDFRTQRLRGQPVLTFWQGTIAHAPTFSNLPPGSPEPGACFYIVDSHYRLLGTLTPRNGFAADVHEFLLTPGGNALFISTKAVRRNLTSYGGPANGAVADDEVQEINLTTGRLVFSWDALDHLKLADSEVPARSANASDGDVWDAFHLNSLDEGPGGQLLISSRSMWAIFDVDRSSGQVVWQLGGRGSDFSPEGADATFAWQHMARFLSHDRISMFDDACCATPGTTPPEPSHGLILKLDFGTMTATKVAGYFHSPELAAYSQGSFETLPNGDRFIGWGAESYYSEYAPAGNSRSDPAGRLLYDVRLPGYEISYRALRDPWVGRPLGSPRGAVARAGGHAVVYASWNGSTETAAWRVLAGHRADALSVVVSSAKRTGFETAIGVRSSGPYFRVEALNQAGVAIGTSRTLVLRAPPVGRG